MSSKTLTVMAMDVLLSGRVYVFLCVQCVCLCDEKETPEPCCLSDSPQYIAGTKENWDSLDISHAGVDVWMDLISPCCYYKLAYMLCPTAVGSGCGLRYKPQTRSSPISPGSIIPLPYLFLSFLLVAVIDRAI